MARYRVTIASPWTAEKAFAYMADLRNLEKWDPGVASSRQVSGDVPGVGAEYDVKVMATVLRYRITEFVEPSRAVAEAKTKLFSSYDVIQVTPTAGGCEVHYDATFEMRGVFGVVANPVVGVFFDRIGDKAAAGMKKALDGTIT